MKDEKDQVQLPENAFRELKEGEEYEPVMSPRKEYPEVNGWSVTWGILMAVLFSAAAAYLNSVAAKVKEWKGAADSTKIEKVSLQNQKSSAEGFVPGFGYASTNLYKVLNGQKVGEWGPVIETELGAVMVRVNNKIEPEASAVETAVKDEVENSSRFVGMTVFNEFVGNLEKGTPVESNLDLFYKE